MPRGQPRDEKSSECNSTVGHNFSPRVFSGKITEEIPRGKTRSDEVEPGKNPPPYKTHVIMQQIVIKETSIEYNMKDVCSNYVFRMVFIRYEIGKTDHAYDRDRRNNFVRYRIVCGLFKPGFFYAIAIKYLTIPLENLVYTVLILSLPSFTVHIHPNKNRKLRNCNYFKNSSSIGTFSLLIPSISHTYIHSW